MGKVLFIETSDIGTRYCGEAVKSLGHEPVFVCELGGYQADPLSQIKSYPHFDRTTADSTELARWILDRKWKDVVGVLSFADSRLKVALEVAQALGVAGPDPIVKTLKDKGEVSKLAGEFGPRTLEFDRNAVPLKKIEKLLEGGAPLIFKPAEGSGAAGIFVLESAEAIANLPGILAKKNLPRFTDQEKWIAQAVVRGDLVSLEGYSSRGRIEFLGFTCRKKIDATESGAGFPVDSTLPSAARLRAEEAVKTLLERSGFSRGYFHVEFIFHGESCDLIDANVGRLGGGPMGELLALSFGIDPVSVFRHAIEVSLFDRKADSPFGKVLTRRDTYSILYGLRKGGKLRSVKIPLKSPCFHTQILGAGAQVSPMGVDDWSWIGILTGLSADVRETIDQIQIETDDGWSSPCY